MPETCEELEQQADRLQKLVGQEETRLAEEMAKRDEAWDELQELAKSWGMAPWPDSEIALNLRIAKLKAELETLEEQVEKHQGDADRAAELDAQIESLGTQNANKLDEIDVLRKEIESLQAEWTQHMLELSGDAPNPDPSGSWLPAHTSELMKEIDGKLAELQALQLEWDALMRQYIAATAEREGIDLGEFDRAVEARDAKKKELDEAERKLEDWKNASGDLAAEYRDAANSVEVIQGGLEELRKNAQRAKAHWEQECADPGEGEEGEEDEPEDESPDQDMPDNRGG